ncbi:uncharacterized protein ACIQIH_009307 [Cyanocitta cristata]
MAVTAPRDNPKASSSFPETAPIVLALAAAADVSSATCNRNEEAAQNQEVRNNSLCLQHGCARVFSHILTASTPGGPVQSSAVTQICVCHVYPSILTGSSSLSNSIDSIPPTITNCPQGFTIPPETQPVQVSWG